MFIKCPECRTVSQLQEPEGRPRLSNNFCSACQRVVQIDLLRDEVKYTSSADSVDKAEPKKILVADDEATIRTIVEELLTAAGYHVVKAQDGEETLILANNERPNLIVLDLVMPGVAGYEIVEGIRKNPFIKDTPILILSGFIFTEEIHDSLRKYGVSDFMSKSQMMTSLVSRVQEMLSRQVHQVA